MKAENRIDLKIDNKGKGRRFESRFLEAGLVKYSFGVCLLNKDALNNFVYKFVGCPVIIDHKDITDENAKDERVGVISKVWYNEFDGWFWCEGVLFDDEAISLIKDKGYNVSCQYNIDDYIENTAGELHNGNPYDLTILDGTPEHLAIVKNPRYEEALIAVNKGEDMKAENTEFRTGYDSDGEAYVYPLEGADGDKSDKKEKKDLYSDENFKENAKRLNEQFGEKPYSQWNKDVQKMLKKYGKTEEDWNNAVGANKELFKKEDKKEDKVKDLYEKEYKKALKEIEEGKDYAQINYNTNIGEMKSALSHLKKFDSDWDKYDVYENIKEYDDLSDDWNKEQIGRIAREKAAQETLKKWISEGKDRTNEYYKIYEPHKLKDKQTTKSEDKNNDFDIKKHLEEVRKNYKNFSDKTLDYLNGLKTNDKTAYKEVMALVKKYFTTVKYLDKKGLLGKKEEIDRIPDYLNSDLKYTPEGEKLREFAKKHGKTYGNLIKTIYELQKKKDKSKAENALEEQLERFVSLVAKNFDESKHKRDEYGKFTDSGNFSGESVDEQEAKLVKELKRLEKNGQDVSEIYKKLTGKEWGKKEAKKESKKENKPVKKSQKSDSVKFDKIGKVLTSILKDAEKSYKESK